MCFIVFDCGLLSFFSDVDGNIVDQQLASRVLEKSTLSLNHICVFYVINNGFLALETTQYSCYDVIIVNEELSDFHSLQFFRILHLVGANVRGVLVRRRDEQLSVFPTTEQEVLGIYASLIQPFSSLQLCEVIINAMKNHPCKKVDFDFAVAATPLSFHSFSYALPPAAFPSLVAGTTSIFPWQEITNGDYSQRVLDSKRMRLNIPSQPDVGITFPIFFPPKSNGTVTKCTTTKEKKKKQNLSKLVLFEEEEKAQKKESISDGCEDNINIVVDYATLPSSDVAVVFPSHDVDVDTTENMKIDVEEDDALLLLALEEIFLPSSSSSDTRLLIRKEEN